MKKKRVERFSGSISGLIFRYSIPPPFSLSKFRDNFPRVWKMIIFFRKNARIYIQEKVLHVWLYTGFSYEISAFSNSADGIYVCLPGLATPCQQLSALRRWKVSDLKGRATEPWTQQSVFYGVFCIPKYKSSREPGDIELGDTGQVVPVSS
jgi:hypothetical protein